jgi:hypothetical protein
MHSWALPGILWDQQWPACRVLSYCGADGYDYAYSYSTYIHSALHITHRCNTVSFPRALRIPFLLQLTFPILRRSVFLLLYFRRAPKYLLPT